WLKKKGVTDIISLEGSEKREKALVESMGMTYHNVSWPDRSAPDSTKVKEVIKILKNVKGKVYQHCLRGVGRDMTMASLIEISRGKNVDSVIQHGRKMAPTWAADQKLTKEGEPSQFHFIR